MGKTGEEDVKEVGKVMGSGRRIESKTSELVYFWDSKSARKTGTL